MRKLTSVCVVTITSNDTIISLGKKHGKIQPWLGFLAAWLHILDYMLIINPCLTREYYGRASFKGGASESWLSPLWIATIHIHNIIESSAIIDRKSCLNRIFLLIITHEVSLASHSVRGHIPLLHLPLDIKYIIPLCKYCHFSSKWIHVAYVHVHMYYTFHTLYEYIHCM